MHVLIPGGVTPSQLVEEEEEEEEGKERWGLSVSPDRQAAGPPPPCSLPDEHPPLRKSDITLIRSLFTCH